MTLNTSRRGFLKAAGAAMLVIGIRPDGALAAGHSSAQLTPFVKIDANGVVTAIVKHFEMGQGPATGLTTLIAEELGLSMDAIEYEFAPSDPSKYNNLFFGPFQGTGGSTAMANSYMQYRQAGAAAREMLIGAAARTWGVEPTTLTLQDRVISGGDNSAPMVDFLSAAAEMDPPANPTLKDPKDFRLIGNPDVPAFPLNHENYGFDRTIVLLNASRSLPASPPTRFGELPLHTFFSSSEAHAETLDVQVILTPPCIFH